MASKPIETTIDYDSAFAAASTSETDFPADPTVTDPPAADPPAAAPPAADPPAADPPAADPPAADPPVADPPAADPPAADPPAAEPPKPATPTADEIVKGLVEQLGKAPPAAPAAGDPPPAADPPAAVYTPEEQQVLADFEKNWPDVHQAQLLQRRAEYHDLTKFIFGEVAKFVQPALDQLSTVGNTMHINELTTKVPDYTPDLDTQVTAWVDTQPSYLQAGMKQVMQSGTSDEVADLIGRYRTATGTAPAPAAPAAAGDPAPKPNGKTELSSAAKKAAESLAPVSGERTSVPQGEDPQDYNSAFAKYAAAEST